jgi:hypothetical protein
MARFWTGWLPRITAGLGIAALAAGGGLAAVDAAQAAGSGGSVPVTDVGLSWQVNLESGGGAYYGGCNFLVAGEVIDDDSPGAHVWTAEEGDELYRTEAGDVTVTKPDAAGNQVAPTWSTKCVDADGNTVNTSAQSGTKNQVNFSGGTGSVNPETNDAELAFDGSFTMVYYGGMTFWSITDPVLSVKNGVGTITGTATGYGADMYDLTQWVKLDATQITVADLKGVDVTETGISVTPEYAGVAIEVEAGGPSAEQKQSGDGWGSFPQSWIDFNVETGQAAYWYSSGGMADPKKTAAPVEISYAESTESYATASPDRVPAGYKDGVDLTAGNLPDGLSGEIGAVVDGELLETTTGATSVPVSGDTASGTWDVSGLPGDTHDIELVEVTAGAEPGPTPEPTESGPTGTDPSETEPAETEPTASEPAATEPADPVLSEAIATTQLQVVGAGVETSPSNLQVNESATSATVTWEWPNEEAPDFDVTVYQGANTSGTAVSSTSTSGDLTTSVTGLTAGTEYTVVVTPNLLGTTWQSASAPFTTTKSDTGGGNTGGGDSDGDGGTTPAPTDDATGGNTGEGDSGDGATMYWGLNMEANGGAYFGGCNVLVAGRTGDAGSSHVWLASEASKLYKAQDGNVSIVKPSGSQLGLASWESKCLDRNGNAVSVTGKDSYSEAQVKLSNGDVVKDDDSGLRIEWTGSFTVVFYGGMTYWSATDPVLELDGNGNGKLTATASGYGASMQDASKWVELDSRTITLANMSGVDMSSIESNGGFVHTPDYLGVAYGGSGEGQEVQGGGGSSTATSQAERNGENQAYWGSFPSDFVDFQNDTGQFSYWFTSNGQRDPYKPTLPMAVSFSDDFAPTLAQYNGQSTPTIDQPVGGGTTTQSGSSAETGAQAPQTTKTGAPAQQAEQATAAAGVTAGRQRLEVTPVMLVSGGSALLGVAGLQWAGAAFFRRRLGLDPSAYL